MNPQRTASLRWQLSILNVAPDCLRSRSVAAEQCVSPTVRRSEIMKSIIACTALSALWLCASSGAIAAGHASVSTSASPPSSAHTTTTPTTTHGPASTGQPNQSCGSATAPNTPGKAAGAPGSAFNPTGKAGTVYAGQQPQNSRNTASVSQYDAACAHQH